METAGIHLPEVNVGPIPKAAMKWSRTDRDTPAILGIAVLETPGALIRRVSSGLGLRRREGSSSGSGLSA